MQAKTENPTPVILSPRFDQALHYAALVHAGQLRKETTIPYLAHLLGVASIALEHGANEDEAIGALLHDAGEDAGGQRRIADIRQRFGEAVAEIVDGCTDTVENPKPAWEERKKKYLDHLPQAPASVRLVSAADKLHNARAILRDHRLVGEAVWGRFNVPKEKTLWYYRALVNAYRQAEPDPPKDELEKMRQELIEELDRVVAELEQRAATA